MKQTRHRWRNTTNSYLPASAQAQEAKAHLPGAADQLGQSVAFRKDQVDARPGYNPTKYGNEVALNSKSAPGQGENDTRLREPRYARLSQSRQLSTSPRHSQ